jgi:hypothetical protein
MGSSVSRFPCNVRSGLPIFPVRETFFTASLTACGLFL